MLLLDSAQARDLDAHAQRLGIPGIALMEAAAAKSCIVACHMLGRRRPTREGPNAGTHRCLVKGHVAILAGKGNNGGDGIALARHLRSLGVGVSLYLCGGAGGLPSEATANLAAWRAAGGAVRDAGEGEGFWDALALNLTHRPALVVDALLGIGQSRPPGGGIGRAVTLVRQVECRPVLSLDVPTGLNADTGRAYSPHIQADVTVTFGYAKPGLFTADGRDTCGRVVVASIGLPGSAGPHALAPGTASLSGEGHGGGETRLFESTLAGEFLPPRAQSTHKGEAGRVLAIAGSAGMTGAAALAGLGAVRGGAGLVTIGTAASQQPVVAASLREAMTIPLADGGRGAIGREALDAALQAAEGADAVALGPGLGRAPETAGFVRDFVNRARRPLVLDADGLNAFEGEAAALAKRRGGRALAITPHPGEAARLLGTGVQEVEADRFAAARLLAGVSNAICLLKGSGTVVAAPGGECFVIPAGNPGMATGGMGDVLTGLVASLWAQYMARAGGERSGALGGEREWQQAALVLAASAAMVHATAGDLAAVAVGPSGLRAGDVAERLPAALAAATTVRTVGLHPRLRPPRLHRPEGPAGGVVLID